MNRRGASRYTGKTIIGRRHFSVAEALHDQRHPGRRHQWSDHLIEELVDIFLLGKGPLQELDKRGSFSAAAPGCAPWCSRRFHSVRPFERRRSTVAHRVEQIDPAAAGYGDERICLAANSRLNLMG